MLKGFRRTLTADNALLAASISQELPVEMRMTGRSGKAFRT